MWWSMVVQLRGQSMQEACAHPEQFLCSYDGSVYGDRQAKKMAKKVGRDYIFRGANVGQPRLVKTPMEPFGAEELADVERALAKGLVPPGMTLEAAEQLRGALDDEEHDGETSDDDATLGPEAVAAARAHGIDFEKVAARLGAELMTLYDDATEGEVVTLPEEVTWRVCRSEIVVASGIEDHGVERAFASVKAAEESDDDATIAAAHAHYERTLSDAITENGLEPVVDALHDRFFSSSVENE